MKALYIFLICLVIILVFAVIYSAKPKDTIQSLKDKILQAKNKLSTFPRKTCKIDYPIYYINMDKNPDRKDSIERALSSIDANYKRVKGFNGYKIIDINHDTVDGFEFFNSYSMLTKGEIGCLMSHLITIQTAWNNGDEIALVCEDDTSFFTCPFIPSLTEVVQNAPKNWGILQLFAGSQKNYKNKVVKYVPRTNEWSCSCYFISRIGMSEILGVVKRNNDPSQFYIVPKIQTAKGKVPDRGEADYYLYGIATTYVISPNLLFPNNVSNQSTLHPEHSPIHLKAELEAYDILINFLS